jgi:hypothetical protein
MTPRRSPNFLRFILTGAVLGFAIGSFLSVSGWLADETSALAQQSNYSATAGWGFVGALGAMLGAIAFALLAILLDRRR